MTTIYYGIDSNYVLHIGGTPTSIAKNSFNDTTSRTSAPGTVIISYINSITTVEFDNAVSPSNTSYGFADFKYLDTFNNGVYLNVSNVTDMSYMFKNCGTYHLQLINGQPTITTSQFNPDFSSGNVSNVTNMSHMFDGCGGSGNVFEPVLTNWNVSNVTDMSYMFNQCLNACKIDFSSWTVSNVTNMSNMFSYVYRADNQARIGNNINRYHPNVSNGDTVNLEHVDEMFYQCSFANFNPDISNGDMSNVLTADSMFYGCSGANFNPDFNKGKLPKATSLSGMFAQCSGASFCPNVANWCVAKDTVLSTAVEMFAGCSGKSFTKLKLNTGNIDYRATITNMFSGCSKLTTIYCNNNGGTTSSGVFSGCNLLRGPYHSANSSYTQGSYARPDTENQTGRFTGNTGICGGYNTNTLYLSQDLSDLNTPFSFHEEEVLNEINIPGYDNRIDIDMVQIDSAIYPQSIAFGFSGCQNWADVDYGSNLHTSYVTNMNSAFKNCASFNENVSNGDTSNVTDMSFMFYHCTDQDFNPDVSNGDISQVTTLQSMFDGCTGNNFNPDFSNGDTSSVTTTEGMFYGCNGNSFNPDVSNGDVSNVTNARYMFAYNSGTSFNPNVSNGDVSNLVNTGYMFRNCSGLTKLDLHNGNLTASEISSYMFYNCTNLKIIYCNYAGSSTSSTGMFTGCSNLVGGNGTSYNANYTTSTYARLDESNSPGYFTKGAIPIDANHLHFSTGDDTPAGRMQIVNGGQLYYEEETGDGIYEGGASDYSSINVNTLENLFIVTNPDSFLNDTSAFLDFLESTGGSSNYFNEMTNLLRSVSPYQAPDCGAYKLTYSFTIPSQNGQVSGTIYIKRTDIISQTFGIGSGYDVQEFSTCSHTHTSSRTYFFDYCEGSGAGACDTDCNCGCEAYVCYDCGGIYPIAGYSCECGDDGTNYLNTGIDPTALPHGSTQLPTTAVAPHTLRQTQINGLYSESYGYVYNNGTEYLDNKSEDFIEVPRQIEDPLNTGPTLLDLLYPIGTYILGDNPYFTPIEKFGGNWTNLSSFYNYRYLGLGGPCMSATRGGSDLSSISYTPAGTVASVTLKPADCNVASGTALSSYGNIGSKTYSSTSFAYSHSHTFAKPVCKSISAASGSPVAYRKTAISGTSTYIEATSANHNTYKLNHQSMQVATTGLTFTNAHNHSVPAIAAANATSGHTHTFTGTAQTLNLNPLAKCVQIGRRDG